jgi:hypothetical protein
MVETASNIESKSEAYSEGRVRLALISLTGLSRLQSTKLQFAKLRLGFL